MPDTRLNGDDFFDAWHEDGDQAFAILQDGCEFPPSMEVFRHGLEVHRERARFPVAVQRYARYLVETYEPRVPGP